MIVLTIMLAIIAFYCAASFYVKKATQYLEASDAPWDRMFKAAKELIADDRSPDPMAWFAAGAVMCAGCGCLTRQVLLDALLSKFRKQRPQPISLLQDASISREQKDLFAKVVINAMYFDSLRAPLSGFLLRKICYPWLKAASEGSIPPRRGPLRIMAQASKEAIEHRKLTQKILQPA